MKIYIAGKITGQERTDVIIKFEAAAMHLKAQGHHPFIPCVLPEYDDVPHEDYLHVCYAMIDICDAIYMLSDWRESRGARKELQYAADWQKEILYEDVATIEPRFPVRYAHPRPSAARKGVTDVSRLAKQALEDN